MSPSQSPISWSHTGSFTCSECGQEFEAEIWLIVDIDERPDLADKIRGGRLHQICCPAGHAGEPDEPLLLYLPGQQPPLLFSPAQTSSAEQDQEHEGGLVGILRQRLGEGWQDGWLQDGLAKLSRELVPVALNEGVAAALEQLSASRNDPIPASFRSDLQQAMQNEQRYLQTSDVRFLDEAARLWEGILGHPEFLTCNQEFQAGVCNEAAGTFLRRYWARGKEKDLLRALELCRQAVALTPKDSPDRAMYLNNLGNGLRDLYARSGVVAHLEEAIDAWQRGRDHVHTAMVSAPETSHLAGQATAINRRLVHAWLDHGSPAEALEATEAGKALGLRLELTRTNRLPEGLTDDEQQQFQDLSLEARQIPSQRRALQEQRTLSDQERASQLHKLSQRHAEIHTQITQMEQRDPNFAVHPCTYADLCDLAGKEKLVLVYLQPLDDAKRGTAAFLVHPASPSEAPAEEDIITLPGLAREDVGQLLVRLPENVENNQIAFADLFDAGKRGELGWFAAYWLPRFAPNHDEQRKARELWPQVMEQILGQLGQLLVPLATRLRELKTKRVVLLPGDRLGLLPLHAVPLSGGALPDWTLGDEFDISYAPSATALARCLQRAHQRAKQKDPTLVAIANPDGSLVFSDDEVDKIAFRFGDKALVAHGKEARKQWLVERSGQADYLELSTHANFQPGNPAGSAFLLAHPEGYIAPRWLSMRGETRFPLADLQQQCERLWLDDLWAGRMPVKEGCVVTADACETGQIDPHDTSEESLGFAAAFLGSGAATVIASLWAVDDQSTSLLMDKTYELMLAPNNLSPVTALKKAGQELRRLPKQKAIKSLQEQIEQLQQEATILKTAKEKGKASEQDKEALSRGRFLLPTLQKRLAELEEGPEFPFAHPIWWAAFAIHGA